MTTQTDSSAPSFFSTVSRVHVYGSAFLMLMLLGGLFSFMGLAHVIALSFRDPVYTQSSVSYSTMDFSAFSGYLLSLIFFLFMAVIIYMVYASEINYVGISGLILCSAVFFLCGHIMTVGVQHSVLSADVETKLVTSALGEDYKIVESGSGNTYVSSDDVAYKFVKTTEDTSITWTLEEVK
jgi:uncharacterized membrane protein